MVRGRAIDGCNGGNGGNGCHGSTARLSPHVERASTPPLPPTVFDDGASHPPRPLLHGSAVPVSKKKVYSTSHDGQTAVNNKVYEGERKVAHQNRLLGSFELSGFPPMPRGVAQIEVWTNAVTADCGVTARCDGRSRAKLGCAPHVDVLYAASAHAREWQHVTPARRHVHTPQQATRSSTPRPPPFGGFARQVSFDVDENGILQVSARELSSGSAAQITISEAMRLGEDEVERMVREAETM